MPDIIGILSSGGGNDNVTKKRRGAFILVVNKTPNERQKLKSRSWVQKWTCKRLFCCKRLFFAEQIRMWVRHKRKKVQWRSSGKISRHSDQNTMWKRPVHKKYIPETVPACPTTEKVVVDGYRRIKRDRYNIIITQDRDTLLKANHCDCILKQMGKVWWREWRDRNFHSVPSILVQL